MMGQGTRMRSKQRLMLAGVALFITLLSLVLTSPAAFAFTATTLGDHGNVTVMEVTGNYDANNPDGTVNADPRMTIAKAYLGSGLHT